MTGTEHSSAPPGLGAQQRAHPERLATGGGADKHLVLRAQDGDLQAFEKLVGRYEGRLFRAAYMLVGNRHDAEDVVQDALVLSWKRLHLLREPEAFRGWLLRICTNEANSVLRRRGRRATHSSAPEDLDALEGASAAASRGDGIGTRRLAAQGDPSHSNEVNAQIAALSEVLARISPELRACWTLREVEEMSYKEIAQTLGVTEATARGRLARARAVVMEQMEAWR